MKRPAVNVDGDGTSSGLKRRKQLSCSDDEDCHKLSKTAGLDESPPMHKIYNSSCRKEKPAELFRKDLISAMKLPDSEQLDEGEFWDVSDTWKQEWERGVQVPVNSKHVPNAEVRSLRNKSKASNFKLPKKLIRTVQDSYFSNDAHIFIDTAAEAEKVCKYDMDDLDCEWLKIYNSRREDWGLPVIEERVMELVLEDFETQCSNRFQDALKTEKGLGIEYDEDVICDVCRSPECEEGNEMVFCDSCNICVHQACYGIMAIPEGSWICRPCTLNIKPSCMLCPNPGGALKSTSSGEKWTHVSCALWVPEVIIGCPEKMEPILRISQIPASRWALICSLCRDRIGACIQCSVKQCKVAYHVTCAFENGLEMEMKSTAVDSQEQGVKMQSFCPKHSKAEIMAEKLNTPNKKERGRRGRKKREVKNKNSDSPVSEVDEHNARLKKIRSLEAEFHKYVNVRDTSDTHSVDSQIISFLFHYWVLKRRAKFNKPLLIAKCDEANLLIKQQENILYSRLKLFVHLRQDLERVRNLCYMVSRREKLFRAYLRVKSDIFEKQCEVLANKPKLTEKEFEEVLRSRLGNSLYDKFYCTEEEIKMENVEESSDKKQSLQKLPNPYAKSYDNGIHTRSRRHTTSQSTMDGNVNTNEDARTIPKLQKCKSEENVSTNKSAFTHSPVVIKIESKHDEGKSKSSDSKEHDNMSRSTHSEEKESNENNVGSLNSEKNRTSQHPDREVHTGEKSNKSLKASVNINETSNDKNFISLSDKENINAHSPGKTRKVKGHIEFRHKDLLSISEFESKNSDLLNNCEENLLYAFRPGTRSTRYQMRMRQRSNSVQEIEEVSPVPELEVHEVKVEIDSPSNNDEEFSSQDHSVKRNSDEGKLDGENSCSSIKIVHKQRGRKRKRAPLQTSIVRTNLPVVDDVTTMSGGDSEKNVSCDEVFELSKVSENSGLRMSLRHSREHFTTKVLDQKPKRPRRSLRTSDSSLQSPVKDDIYSENSDTKSVMDASSSSPDWDPGDSPPRMLCSIEPPVSPRLVIRLRKDPNRETWKNDSSSSSDVPTAFKIVRNDWDASGEDSGSQFSSETRSKSTVETHTFTDRNDGENGHRYLMRERAVPQRSLKYAFGRS